MEKEYKNLLMLYNTLAWLFPTKQKEKEDTYPF